MPIKILAGLIAIVLMLAYLGPMLVKMKDVALGAVVLIGIGVMLADLWYSLRKPDD